MEELFPLESSWIVALAAGALAIVMVLQLRRSLPVQNIVMIVVSLLAAEAGLEYFLSNYARVELSGPLWCYLAGAALLWTAVILSFRRVSQFILRPWRRGKYYGIWLIGMSAVFVAAFQFGWPCVNIAPDADPLDPGKAAIMAGIRGLVTAGLFVVLMPFFLRKRPVKRVEPSELAQQPQKEAH
jgi:hypothetical protein